MGLDVLMRAVTRDIGSVLARGCLHDRLDNVNSIVWYTHDETAVPEPKLTR